MKSKGPSPEVQANQSLLKTGEVCDRFKVSRDWVYHRVRPDALDSLPYVRLGRVLRFEPEKVQQYLEAHRKIDNGGRLATTDGIVRVNARRKRAMARKRFQKGHVRLRGKRDRYWEGFYREDILHPDGRLERKQRSRNLGRLVDIQTKRLAERKLAEILNDVNDVDYRPRPVATLREFVEQKYMKLKLSQKKKLTQDSYRLNLNKHILPALGDRPLVEIDQEDVQALLNQKADQGLSRSTVRNIRTIVSSVFSTAVKYDYRKSNPARGAELPPRPPRKIIRLHSDKELRRLEKALPEKEGIMVWLARATGLRAGELSGLRRRAFDRKRKWLWVVETYHEGHFQAPKSHRSERPIELSEEDTKRLAEYLRRTPNASENDWLFPNCRGTGPVRTHNVLRRVIQPAAKRLGLPHVTWHLLRHWNATVMHEEGVPLKVAQERLGHARAETTMTYYVHPRDEVGERAAETISRRVNGSRRRRKRSYRRNSVSRIVSRSGVRRV